MAEGEGGGYGERGEGGGDVVDEGGLCGAVGGLKLRVRGGTWRHQRERTTGRGWGGWRVG